MFDDFVSIVVPVYRAEKYIDKCVSSIINQTYRHIEVILVLDGEIDKSGEICKSYAEKYSNVYVLSQKNQGVSVARNRGIEFAHGNWIMFIDSDDWIEPDCVEVLLENALSNNCDIAICGYYTDYKDKIEKNTFFSFTNHFFTKNEKHDLIKNCMIPVSFGNVPGATNVGVPWAKIYNCNLLKKYGLSFVEGLPIMEDMLFNIYAFHCSASVYYFNVPLYHYIKNNNSATVTYRKNFLDTVILIINEVENFIQRHNAEFLKDALLMKKVLLYQDLVVYKFVPEYNIYGFSSVCSEMRIALNDVLFFSAVKNCGYENFSFKKKIMLFLMKLHFVEPILLYMIYKEKQNRKKFKQ